MNLTTVSQPVLLRGSVWQSISSLRRGLEFIISHLEHQDQCEIFFGLIPRSETENHAIAINLKYDEKYSESLVFQTKSRNRILTLVCRNKTKPEFSLSVDVVDQWFFFLRCVWWGFFGSSNLFGILRDCKVSFTLCSRLIRYVLNFMASNMSK